MTSATEQDIQGAIAIIGIACRVPGAGDHHALWRNIRAGTDSISHFSRDEALADGAERDAVADPGFVPAGGILDDALAFDAPLFGYSPRDATAMDPQHRALLQSAWAALEDAGCRPDSFKGPIGVFAGTTVSTYLLNRLQRASAWQDRDSQADAAYGNFPGFAATRISYKLNLTGPSLNVQTACSTSLVAVHLACQSLLNFECDMALAGGASIRMPQRGGYVYEPEGILSPDGLCRVFDRGANGTVFGNGVGIVVLKRLEDAIADRDRIDAVILGSAINNDGAQKAGYTAPGVRGQAAVIEAAQRVAGIDPADIGYVETHGTGTALGDPIELRALTEIFRRHTQDIQFCALGSLKGNVGHLDAAAGVCSLIKAVQTLRHGIIPPVPHFTSPNPRLEIERSPFYVPATELAWPQGGAKPRVAGVSSFGFGGTNAHVVLRHWDNPPPARESETAPQLLLVSAGTRRGVDDLARRIATFDGWDETTPRAVGATLRATRRAHAYRRAAVAGTAAEARAALQAATDAPEPTPALPDLKRVFMFTGQGAQHAGMARLLYARSAPFRDALDHCARRLEPELGLDLRTLVLAHGADADGANATLRRTRFTQPALFAVAHALTRWWASLGVVPDAMIGHSIGEYAAACCAGVFELDDALRLVAARGRLMDEMPAGAMLAVPLPAEALELPPDIELAALNAPDLTVVGGPTAAVEAFSRALARRGIEARLLRTSHAFHSASMDGALDRFREVLAGVERKVPTCRIACNLTGDWLSDAQARSIDYWADQLRRPVLFSAGMRRILEIGAAALIEIGPGATLVSLARLHLATPDRQRAIPTLPRPDEQTDDHRHALAAAGKLWALGGTLDWSEPAGQREIPVSLPTYPFERKIFAVDADLVGVDAPTSLRKRPDPSSWAYVAGWTSRPLPAAAAHPAAPETWIVLTDDAELGQRLRARAMQLPVPPRLISVEAGATFEQVAPDRYRIPTADPAAWPRLLGAPTIVPGAAIRIIDVRHVEAVPELPHDAVRRLAADRATLDTTLFALMPLAQALTAQPGETRTSLLVVASGVASVMGDEPLDPARSAMLALCRVLPAEIDGLAARLVDIDPRQIRSADALAALVVDEAAADDNETYVAWRGRRRWSFAPTPGALPRAELGAGRLRAGGTYLVTGGLGGIGLAIARHLAVGAGARLILAGRRIPPARDSWPTWLADAAVDPIESTTIRAIQEIEALGAQTHLVSADMSDAGAVAAMLASARARFGRIDGIVHAAGAAGGGVVAMQSAAKLWNAMAAKTAGAAALVALTADDPPDFLLLCSSLTALVGTAGRLDYTAANLFMDALAIDACRQGRNDVISVNWDLWVDTGMAREIKASSAAMSQLGDAGAGLTASEALDMFERVLAQREPNVIVSVRDLPGLMRHMATAAAPAGATKSGDDATANGDGDRSGVSATYRPPSSDLERRIVEAWELVLGVRQVGLDDDFFELGGDSLLALRLAGRLRPILRQEVGPRSIMENPTIATLSKALAPADPPAARAAALRSKIDAMSPDEIRALLARKSAARPER